MANTEPSEHLIKSNVSYKEALMDSTMDNVVSSDLLVATKPPIVPIKRKKAVGRSTESLVDLNDIKRQKFETKLVVNKENKPYTMDSKPPLPPKPKCLNAAFEMKTPKLKKRNDDSNVMLIQNLRAQTEQLRLEISDLKIALNVEKNAVRSLRAQTESETRKAKLNKRKQEEAVVQFHQRKPQQQQQQQPLTTKPPKIPKKNQEPAANSLTADIAKLTNEIVKLKELNKTLEEKLQLSLESERRNATDIRVQKDAYELRLTQLTKSAKTQIHRMVDAMKTKDKQIEKLKKEIDTLKETNKKELIDKLTHNDQEMRKTKSNKRINTQNQETQTTCNDDEKINQTSTMSINSINITIAAHGQEQIIDTDNDSALSSGPTSISPLPSNELNGTPVNMLWKIDQKSASRNDDEYRRLEEEKQFIEDELEMAKEQIETLEKFVKMIQEQSDVKKLRDTVSRLRNKEEALLKETHELQEQNELLEFRIIELEEGNDKCSTRNRSSSADTRDMWTDTEDNMVSGKVHTTVERTDSGITSPSHHSVQSMEIEPAEVSIIDKISNDDLRQRLSHILMRNAHDEDDKICLYQVLSLLNNLEALTQDQAITNDQMVIDEDIKSSVDCKLTNTTQRPLGSTAKGQSRIVATVQPYNNTNINQLEESITGGSAPKKTRSSSYVSLQESGIFEGDNFESQLVNQTTQTDPTDFPGQDKATGDLCAEIQKLNKFREKIEECATKTSGHIVHKSVVNLLPTNNTNENHLRFYQRRVEFLENKIAIYESSGDTQIQRLAKRLQRELELESSAKHLGIQVQKLKGENLRLEEERCELEEIENDTRLRLQKLEVELEILSQRNIELEMSRDTAKAHANCLQDTVCKAQERIIALEEHEHELKHKMDMITTFMPAILLFNSWKVNEAKKPEPDCSRFQVNNTPMCACLQRRSGAGPSSGGGNNAALLERLSDMMGREKELTQNIAELNRAYNETLESADNLWAQMEKEYKDKLSKAEENECVLKCKINQLEERLKCDSVYAQERINQLEESENGLKHRICRMNRDHKDVFVKHQELKEEYNTLKEEHLTLKAYMEGPAADNLERERKKAKDMAEEVTLATKMLNDMEEVHNNELQLIKAQLAKAHKEVIQIEVTNSELREEVTTLENALRDSRQQKEFDEEMIKDIMNELKVKSDVLGSVEPVAGRSLAQEMGAPAARLDLSNVNNLNSAAEKLAQALNNYEIVGIPFV